MVAFIEMEQKGDQDINNFYIHGNTVVKFDTDAIDYYLAIHKHINNFYLIFMNMSILVFLL